MQEIPLLEREYTIPEFFVMFLLLSPIIIGYCYIMLYIVEIIYQRNFKKPLIVFGHIFTKKLSETDKMILKNNCQFYRRLKPKYKIYFEHRVATFIEKTRFSTRDISISQEMKLSIAAVYIQLTFGMKNYLNRLIQHIIIYPDVYLSTHTDEYYKGEFNPTMKTVVFSWADFKEGIAIENDNLNLGLHEFTHALHFATLKSDKPTHVLFNETLRELFLSFSNETLRQDLLNSGFLREYAFKNQYEFVAVLLECFFESPEDLKQKFPSVYSKVKEMLNYNEAVFI
ncbi:MAG: zinc-dependent peptidase [Bacteroidota bacterium]